MTQGRIAIADSLFMGGGEMGARMRLFDWSQTSLGAVEQWSQSLKTAVRIMLTSRQAMFVWWGDDLINLYNDAYQAILGGKHPDALGQPASFVWREIWDQVGPRAESAMLKNEGTYDEALLLIMERNGYAEETYYTFSYSPVPDDQGQTRGIICANTDDTRRIVGERQLALLRELAARTADARTFDEACTLSANCLNTNPYDLPFAMIYLLDPDQRCAHLAGISGIDRGHPLAPETVTFDDRICPFASLLQSHQACLIPGLDTQFQNLPTGAWTRPPHQAVAVPIAPSGQTGKAGILIAGLNPFRLLDDHYRGFVDLVAAQIAASIANAQAYEEERKRAEALAELDRAKTAFFSNVSHEFRTPLTLMLGPLEDTLNQPDRLNPTDRQQLETVYRNSLRLLKLVNTLLDFSRIEAGRVQAVYEPTDLAMLTADLAGVFRSAIERAGIKLVVDCPSLPEPVYVDREMWEKIVLNLLSNAFKFTFRGEIRVSLQVQEKLNKPDSQQPHARLIPPPAQPSLVILRVCDTGTGIPPEELPHIFERFHRVQGARGRTYEGSGIGLSLVQELVQLHGGTIEVSSVVDQGTQFTVLIPIGTVHLPKERINASRTLASTAVGATPYVEEALRWLPEERRTPEAWEPEAPNSSAPLPFYPSTPLPASARIFLVDDNADMRDYVKRLLSQQYEVEAFGDGMAALTAIRQDCPDLVLTDVMMPELDGFGLLRELRSDPKTQELPIILLSARAGEESRVEGLEAGADDYLIKPFSARELLARVEANLKMAQLRQEATRREQAQRQEAETARAQLESVLSSINDQFLVLNRAWQYVYVNDRAVETVGIPRENLLGKSVWDLFPDLVDSEFYIQVHRSVAEQTPVHFEYYYPSWNRWFENHVYPSSDQITIFVTEITDRKRAEIEREQLLTREQTARAEAERANRLKDEFLAIVSHELRSPLNPILGWATLLQTQKLDAIKTTQALGIIERNARLQAELIEDLLDLSRILQGKLSLNVHPVNLASTIQAALETVRLSLEAKRIQVHTSFDPDVGLVAGDSSRLQQVVWNLLSNAIKFTPEGGRVSVRLEQVEREEASTAIDRQVNEKPFTPPLCHPYAQITISDTGKGIAAKFLPYVFDYFRQEDSATTRKFGGLGLGLAIVHHLVELHGGTVQATSPGEGQGATFAVKLPLMPTSPQTSQPDPSFESALDLTGTQVLVVDDDADTREFVAFLIEQYGAQVIAVGSASEALIELTRSQPDILLSDIGMPEIDGYMLMQQVRTLPPEQGGQIPAISLTAYAGEINHQQAIAAGFQAHIAKPVEPDTLIRTIASFVKSTQ